MASSIEDDMDKRTKSLSNKKIEKGHGLQEQQLSQNQLQAIQDERRSNLMEERAVANSEDANQELLGQAATIATESTGPGTVATLKKYGISAPRVMKQESHDVKVQKPNITINNNTYSTTNNTSGPVGGRDIAFKDDSGQNSQSKFKNWLTSVFLQNHQNSVKREREFDRRESNLVRSSNKMLSRIEAAGQDIATNLNPANIGQTVGNQIRILFMIFALRFLSKHWTKVLDGITWVGEKIRSGLDYFGVTDAGKKMMARGGGIRGDIISLFGGNPRKENLFQVFKRLGEDLIDHLKKKLDHAMELRGDAIKAIKFPALGGDISSMLSGIAGYLGNILTALVDPKAGVQASIRTNISQAGLRSMTQAQTEEEGPSRGRSTGWIKDTSVGDAALVETLNGKRRYSMLEGSVKGGMLQDNAVSEVSQSMDLLGALNDAKTKGKIETARVATGFQRMDERIDKNGTFTVDPEFIKRYFGANAAELEKSGHIQEKQYKFVRVPKTEEDYYNENALGFVGGMVKQGSAFALGNTINNVTGGIGGQAVGGTIAGTPTAGLSEVLEGTIGKLPGGRGLYQSMGTLGAGFGNAINRAKANGYKLMMVDKDDNRYGGAVKGPDGKGYFRNFYTIDKYALQQLMGKLYHTDKVDLGNEQFLKSVERSLTQHAGGEQAARLKYTGEGSNKDYNVSEGFSSLRDMSNKEAKFTTEENNDKWTQDTRTIGNNFDRLGEKMWDESAEALEGAGRYVKGFAKANSREQLSNAKYLMERLVNDAGLTREQAAGVIGNISVESGFNPRALHKDSNGQLSGGLVQWNGANLSRLIEYANSRNRSWRDLDVQADFLIESFRNPHLYPFGPDTYDRLIRAQSPDEAARQFFGYERFAGYRGNSETGNNRIAESVSLYNKLTGSNIPMPTLQRNTSEDNDKFLKGDTTGNGSIAGSVGGFIEKAGSKMEGANPFKPKSEAEIKGQNANSNIRLESVKMYNISPYLREKYGSDFNTFETSWVGHNRETRASDMRKSQQYNWAMSTWNKFKTDWKRHKYLGKSAHDFAEKISILSAKDFSEVTKYYSQLAQNINKDAGFNYDEMKKKYGEFDITGVSNLSMGFGDAKSDINKKIIEMIQSGDIEGARNYLKSEMLNTRGVLSPSHVEGNERRTRMGMYNEALGNFDKTVNYFRHQGSYEDIDKKLEANQKELVDAINKNKTNPSKELEDKIAKLRGEKSDLEVRKKSIGSTDIGDLGLLKGDKNSKAIQDSIGKIDRLGMEKASVSKKLDALKNRLVGVDDTATRKAMNEEYDRLEAQLSDIDKQLTDEVLRTNKNIKGQRARIKKNEELLGRNMNEIEDQYKNLVSSGKSSTEAILELQKKYGADVISYLKENAKELLKEAAAEREAIKKIRAEIMSQLGLDPNNENIPVGIRLDKNTPDSVFPGKTPEEKHKNKLLWLLRDNVANFTSESSLVELDKYGIPRPEVGKNYKFRTNTTTGKINSFKLITGEKNKALETYNKNPFVVRNPSFSDYIPQETRDDIKNMSEGITHIVKTSTVSASANAVTAAKVGNNQGGGTHTVKRVKGATNSGR